jgi:hypothetical protein
MSEQIMDLEQFTLRLSEKYDGVKQVDIEDIEKWSKSAGINDYAQLYDQIVFTYPYKTFPSLFFIRSAYGEISGSSALDLSGEGGVIGKIKYARDNWKKIDIKKIIEKAKELRRKVYSPGSNFDDLDILDKEFFCLYNDLYIEYDDLKEYGIVGEAMKSHLVLVRDAIENYESFSRARDIFNQSPRENKFLSGENRVGKTIPIKDLFSGVK